VGEETVKDIDLIGLLLHQVAMRLRVEAGALVAGAAGDGFVVTGQGRVTAAHFRLLDRLPPEGARASDLAVSMGVTKQALGQLVQQLADRGYVETVADPRDRRAKLVRATSRGTAAVRTAREAVARVEEQWRAEVGAERYAVFRAVLGELSGVSSRRSAP
jgi:DNA-binding MarR family transcriptional regulator